MKPLISIVIVNWNGHKWLPACFGSLARQEYKNFEIIFVDNASRDGSVAWVRKHHPPTSVILNKENLGFSDANNIGYRNAKGKYVLFLNNDTRVTKTFLTELVRVMESDRVIGGVQSKILLIDRPDTYDSVGAFLTPTGFLYHYGFGKKDQTKYDKQIDLYTAKGACMMFRKDVLDGVAIGRNIFDPDYFAYFEESDLCHRVWLAGFRIVYAYKSVIYHKMGATSSSMNNTFLQYHSFKNRIRTFLKNLGVGWLLVIMPLHILISQFYALLSVLKGHGDISLAIEKSMSWNVMHLRKTLYLRKIIQTKMRKVTDRSLMPSIMRCPPVRYYAASLTNLQTYEE